MNPSILSHSPHSGWSLTLGILLMILGLLVIGAQAFTTYVSLLFIGWMLILSGAIEFVYGFFSGSYEQAAFFFIGGFFSFVIGALIAAFPDLSAATFTLMIGMFMVIIGLYNTFSSFISRYDNWGYAFSGGLLTTLFGLVILAQWPISGTWVIGFFIGIEFFLSGFLLTMNFIKPTEEKDVRFRETTYYGVKGGSMEKSNHMKNIYKNQL